MSWIRSAVNRAVEAGGNSHLSSTVRSYKDSVVQKAGQAVVGGARLLQDRIGARNFQNFKLAVKRLEEVSVSCRGIERVQLLRRWLVALKEIERLNEAINSHHHDVSNVSNDSPTKPTVILYYDPDHGGEPMNFCDVFLHSQALEGITLSLILEEPNEEEVSLLLKIFGLCLMGGKEAHNVTVDSIRDLAKAFSIYNDEVLAKREELLQYAQDAIAGLKVNAAVVRIDCEVSSIHQKLDEMEKQLPLSEGSNKSSEAASGVLTETSKEALECIRHSSRLEELLLEKKFLKIGDSSTAHNQKVDKLKILSESLASSASKAEKRISDTRMQKEEALKFRVTKTNEVSHLEKELTNEIEALEKRKDELVAELKKVTAALTSAHARLHNAREERDQFDEDSNQILQHFMLKEDDLSRAIASYRAEAEVCNTFVNFLENTWVFQSSHAEQKDKLVNDELERHQQFFVNLAMRLLSAYKEELGPSIAPIRDIVENLKRLDATAAMDENIDLVNSRRGLEEQYQTLETKFLTTFSVVESITKQFYSEEDMISRKRDVRMKELLDALEKIKQEFESIERPTLEFETSNMTEETPSKGKTPRIPFLSPRQASKDKLGLDFKSKSVNELQGGVALAFSPRLSLPLTQNRTSRVPVSKQMERLESLTTIEKKKSSDAEAQLSKLKMDLELENHVIDNSMEGINDWEFDEKIEKELRKSV